MKEGRRGRTKGEVYVNLKESDRIQSGDLGRLVFIQSQFSPQTFKQMMLLHPALLLQHVVTLQTNRNTCQHHAALRDTNRPGEDDHTLT